jgi:hypothetical protein
MTVSFPHYWNLALASVDRQLVTAISACTDRGLATHSSPASIRGILEMIESVTPVQSLQDAHAMPDSGHKILSSDGHFRATLKWLQEEIRDLVFMLPVNGYEAEHAAIARVLMLSAEDTAHRFGTLTEGWDTLVTIKHKLLLPDDAVLARSAWLVSLMADFERSLREAICLTIECLGRLEFINRAAADTVTEQRINLLPHDILRYEKTENAVAQAFRSRWLMELFQHLASQDVLPNT